VRPAFSLLFSLASGAGLSVAAIAWDDEETQTYDYRKPGCGRIAAIRNAWDHGVEGGQRL
jgi:hypothetical protein